MDTLRNFLILFFMVSVTLSSCSGTADVNSTSDTIFKKNLQSSKGREMRSYIGMIGCAVKYDFSCFLNVAEDYLEMQKTELLAEADAEALQSSGRSDPESKPSYLASIIGKLMKEVSAMFQDGLGGFMKTARESDDEEDDEDDDSDSNVTAVEARKSSEDLPEAQSRELDQKQKKKKNKKPKKAFYRVAKVALIALVVFLKLGILLKALQTAIQFKFLLVSVGTFAIQAVKFWTNFRNKKNDDHHEEIVYKNPYGGDEYSSPPGAVGGGPYGGEYNGVGRNLRDSTKMAYSGQINM
ncbi:uncharacterized protein LOC115882762 isoform X2 [Sitophilus oryzae]|uniref:Uncharacterized protein LOC115882762 isoform X2 n=1 Tax=Sitophilus oryzae TaxID=7048 RepID=A0A6J2Y0N5_SITOR|nr:uncharacterized protein LOC115882762 isoform X2 [Sitophilus oryzae]